MPTPWFVCRLALWCLSTLSEASQIKQHLHCSEYNGIVGRLVTHTSLYCPSVFTLEMWIIQSQEDEKD